MIEYGRGRQVCPYVRCSRKICIHCREIGHGVQLLYCFISEVAGNKAVFHRYELKIKGDKGEDFNCKSNAQF